MNRILNAIPETLRSLMRELLRSLVRTYGDKPWTGTVLLKDREFQFAQ
jgi:hypothetical protein